MPHAAKHENIIPKLDFHDASLNLICHGPIHKCKIERYTSMETRVVETLQDYNILYPCDVYILPQSESNRQEIYFQIQNSKLITGSIIKNASECAIEESLKTEIRNKSKAERIENLRSVLLKKLAMEDKLKRKVNIKYCKMNADQVKPPTKIPNLKFS